MDNETSVSKAARALLGRLARSPRPGIGGLGRLLVKNVGWPLACGMRIHIDNAHEWIQSEILRDRYETNLVAVLSTLLDPGDLFFDVGANIGYITLVAASRGARVHSFEPVPYLAKRLQRNLSLNGLKNLVQVSQVALGKSVGTAKLYVANRPDDGSHSLVAGVPATSTYAIETPISTIDDQVRNLRGQAPSVIKIDVEGAEALVLDGAVELLNSDARPVYILETGDRLSDALNESAATVLHRFFSRGYRVFLISEHGIGVQEVEEKAVSGALENYLAVHPQCAKIDRVAKLQYQSV